MKSWKTQSHVRWDCKYHLVFISKYRQRAIYGKVRKNIGGIIRNLCRQKGIEFLKHTTEIQCIEYRWMHKGKKCNPNPS